MLSRSVQPYGMLAGGERYGAFRSGRERWPRRRRRHRSANERGDLDVVRDRIVSIGTVDGRGRRENDAASLVVAPGVVDAHAGTDARSGHVLGAGLSAVT